MGTETTNCQRPATWCSSARRGRRRSGVRGRTRGYSPCRGRQCTQCGRPCPEEGCTQPAGLPASSASPMLCCPPPEADAEVTSQRPGQERRPSSAKAAAGLLQAHPVVEEIIDN